MLEKVQNFGDSLSREQYKKIESALGEKLFGLLETALDSETDEDAQQNVAAFIEGAKRNKLKVLALRQHLSREQREMLLELWEQNDND